MGGNKSKVEIFSGTNSSQVDFLKEEIQVLVKNFNFNHQQLSKILNLSKIELENIMNNKGDISNEHFEKIENKLTMLNFGFEGFDARKRAILILNDLLTDYMLSTKNISEIIHVEEQELIDFRQQQLKNENVELKICVNIIMLHFVLRN